MKKRLAAFSLAFLTILLTALAAGCADNAEQTLSDDVSDDVSDEVTAAVETEPAIVKPDLPDTDWQGENFNVLARKNNTYSQFTNFEFYSEAMDGEVVNDAVYTRNKTIEERYNVVITQDNSSENTEGTFKKVVTSADDVFDLVAIDKLSVAASNAGSGYLLDLNAVEYLDFAKPWWNTDINEFIEFAGRLYYTTSDLLLMDKHRAYIMIFNKGLAETFGYSSLYDVVRDGKWTADYMLKILKTASNDTDGDGKVTVADSFGLGMDSYNAFFTFYGALGGTIVGRDGDDLPTLIVNNERNISIIDKVIELTCDESMSVFCNDYNGKVDYDYWSVSSTLFYANQCVFMVAFPHSLKSVSSKTDESFDYGVLPYPKFDEEQDIYRTIPDPVASMVFGVPITTATPSFSGFMIEALSAESTYTTLPAYYEVSCKNKYTYDVDSAEMLDITFAGMTYDLGAIYNWGGLGDMFTAKIPAAKENIFASSYAKVEKSAVKAMEKTIENFTANMG